MTAVSTDRPNKSDASKRGFSTSQQKAKMMENLNRKKFVTDKDAEIEKIRLKDEQLKDRKRASLEPFWQDMNQSIQSVSKQREAGLINRHGKQAIAKQQHEIAMKKPQHLRNFSQSMNQTQVIISHMNLTKNSHEDSD